MIVFKTYLKLLWTSWGIILPYFVIFLVLSIVMGQQFGSRTENVFEATKIEAVISAPAGYTSADELQAWLTNQGHRVTRRQMTERDAREEIFLERIQAAYLFSEKEADPPVVLADQKSGSGYYAGVMAEMFLRFLDAYRGEDGTLDKDALYSALSQEMKTEIDVSEKTNDSENGMDSIVGAMSGAAYVLMIVSMTLIPLVNEAFTRPGVYERTISAPYRTRRRALELYMGSGLVVFAAAVIFYGISLISIGKYFTPGHFWRVSANFAVFSICVLAMSFLLANITRSRAAITAISSVLSLGLAFLSGAFVPQELVSDTVLNMSKAFPLYYFIHANRHSLNWDIMAPDILTEAGFAVLYILIAFILLRVSGRARKIMKTAGTTAGDIGA
ncbi:MAG TPA: ABC transporter permease [Bacillota bacterium]|nr:ABC transporter permease [Bacillota bacterium]